MSTVKSTWSRAAFAAAVAVALGFGAAQAYAAPGAAPQAQRYCSDGACGNTCGSMGMSGGCVGPNCVCWPL